MLKRRSNKYQRTANIMFHFFPRRHVYSQHYDVGIQNGCDSRFGPVRCRSVFAPVVIFDGHLLWTEAARRRLAGRTPSAVRRPPYGCCAAGGDRKIPAGRWMPPQRARWKCGTRARAGVAVRRGAETPRAQRRRRAGDSRAGSRSAGSAGRAERCRTARWVPSLPSCRTAASVASPGSRAVDPSHCNSARTQCL